MDGLFGSVWTFFGMAAALLGLAAIAGWSSGGVLPAEMMVAPLALIQGIRRRDGLGDSLYANQRCQE